ncbi:hypothetical protein CULT_1060019 [[Clostridium] ultunense Esp]|nr:hypothetical protein CULT_1060019 [[Clostridium] ultunense Esp]
MSPFNLIFCKNNRKFVYYTKNLKPDNTDFRKIYKDSPYNYMGLSLQLLMIQIGLSHLSLNYSILLYFVNKVKFHILIY